MRGVPSSSGSVFTKLPASNRLIVESNCARQAGLIAAMPGLPDPSVVATGFRHAAAGRTPRVADVSSPVSKLNTVEMTRPWNKSERSEVEGYS